eukprot:CAMPEP_0195251296 /NCGR_PEP_ID=MMETSP0706-20130129/3202_1 /TAXON_ID=33640 /ORGANISM="Asterionellopsis glacialis, Strain CCMP134" /LENGTH=211 /DNA_ID=CAMNT_0040303413 /DNA_START=1 /DNA_END=636 /DNA_ORIENTATION=+
MVPLLQQALVRPPMALVRDMALLLVRVTGLLPPVRGMGLLLVRVTVLRRRRSSSSYGGYGSSSYGGGSYGGSSSSGSWGGSKGSLKHKVSIPMWGIILGATAFIIATAGGMIYTAYQFERKPESMYANFCRLSINTVSCTYMVLYNLYHCRLSEVQAILMPDEEGDEYTDEEIERMKLRPGIAKALEREHNKAFRKNDARSSIELKKITRK